MKRPYVVLPRPEAAVALPQSGRRFSIAERTKQLRETAELVEADPLLNELRAELESRPAALHGVVLSRTGAGLVSAEPDAVEELIRRRPEFLFIRDGDRSVLGPEEAGRNHRAAVSEAEFWHLGAIEIERARGNGIEGRGVTVAVLDTGVDSAHSALAGRVVGAAKYDINAWNAVPTEPSVDMEGHGTHVAGLIAGLGVGVAPAAQLYAGVAAPFGVTSVQRLLLALESVMRIPEVQIINLSIGVHGFQAGLAQVLSACRSSGMLPVAAVGNGGKNRTITPGNYRECLCVGAVDQEGRVPAFSGNGRITADHHAYDVPELAAPGVGIYSCGPDDGFEERDGTSMSAAIASGLAACLLEERPGLDVLELEQTLLEACRPLHAPSGRAGAGGVVYPTGL